MIITKVEKSKDVPYHLLELADPSRKQIDSYLNSGSCYIGKIGSEIVGALVLTKISSKKIEIKNIAISELLQGKGYGKQFLQFAE